jgi:peptidoglycan biosynthesis protein MviN/MurJ (putative lipid II flippase)
LAIGTAIAALFNASCLFFVLSRRIDGIDGRRVFVATAKILIASLAMGAAAWLTENWLNQALPQVTSLGWMAVTTRAGIRVFGAIGAGLLVLCLAAWALRLQEFMDVARKILSKVKR